MASRVNRRRGTKTKAIGGGKRYMKARNSRVWKLNGTFQPTADNPHKPIRKA